VEGYKTGKNSVESFRQHEKNKSHRETTTQFQTQISKQPSIATQLDSQLRAQQNYRCEMLLKQPTSLRYLMSQGVAVEGHDAHNGYLFQLLQPRAEDCPDLCQWLNDKNYMSHDINNELIQLISLDILQRLLEKIHEAGFYSILADETCDTVNKKQLVVLFHWVDEEYTIHEDFIGLVDLPQTDSATIYSVLNDILIRCNIPPGLCRGQAYDSASNMSGHIRGVAARFKQQNPAAIHIHCLAHCTNLCLQDVSKKNPKLENSLSYMIDALKAILDNYSVLCAAMTETNNDSHDEYGRRAGGILAMLDKLDTFYGLCLSYLVFSATEQLSRTLQAVNTSLHNARNAVQLTSGNLQNRPAKHSTTEDARDLTAAPVLPRHHRPPIRIDEGEKKKNHTFQSPESFYRKQYYKLLDLLDNELAWRFEQKDTIVASDIEQLLLTSANEETIKFPTTTLETYSNDFDRLHTQLLMMPETLKESAKGNKIKKVTSIRTISDAMNVVLVSKRLLPEVHKLLRLHYTVPVTTATAERCFSSLRRIKNYLQSKMTQKRLNDLMCGYCHKEALSETDMTSTTSEFAQRNTEF
uniref:HAT C-terminal dimerisation domain-containing protein n=1 Tax=Latimeria chalumnae TaxID=7897 RepID=H3A554_LATCH